MSLKNGVKFQYVAGDIWFSSKENMPHVKNSGKDFVSAIKSNRLVAVSRNDKLAGKLINLSALKLDGGSVKEIYIQGLDFQVFINVAGSQGIIYLVTSDVNLILAKQLKSQDLRIPSPNKNASLR